MLKQLITGLLLACAPAAYAEPPTRSNLSQLEHDRELMVGMKLRLPVSRHDREMSLQFGAHYQQEGDFRFVPIMAFQSQDGWASLALEGSTSDEPNGLNSTSLLLIGGGVLLVAAVASGTSDSDDEPCKTDSLFDLLECIDED